ncbi:MAG: hypothetical protein M3335_07785 [Actinomycetota bacterium]|nr:hypothetical protein [Actinomycetota bacterium]
MDLDRLSTGEKIAGISGVLLFIFTFLDWFEIDVPQGVFPDTGINAWDALDLIPIVLMLAVIAAVALAVIRLTDALFEPPISLSAVVAVLGGLSVLLILFRIVNPPGESGVATVGVDVGPAFGIFLALVAAAGVAYGGYRAMQEEGITFADVADELSSRRG